MSFTNVYYKRTAGTPKACYVCYKPTTTVLATIDTVDFLYTCPGHLEDRGFASSLGGGNGPGGGRQVEVTAEEIAKVKAEWEEKQKKLDKKAKEKEKEKEKEKKTDDDEVKVKAKAKGTSSQDVSTSLSKLAPASTPSPAPTHQRYALHADFFAIRQSEHRRRRQAAQVKALAPQLPRAPSGSVENKY